MNISIYKYKTKMFFMYTSLLHRLEIEFNNIFYILEISACFFGRLSKNYFVYQKALIRTFHIRFFTIQ